MSGGMAGDILPLEHASSVFGLQAAAIGRVSLRACMIYTIRVKLDSSGRLYSNNALLTISSDIFFSCEARALGGAPPPVVCPFLAFIELAQSTKSMMVLGRVGLSCVGFSLKVQQ